MTDKQVQLELMAILWAILSAICFIAVLIKPYTSVKILSGISITFALVYFIQAVLRTNNNGINGNQKNK